MTSREWLALAVIATPALGACLVALAPRRALSVVAVATGIVTATAALALATVALASPSERLVGRWVVVDVAGAIVVAVAGLVGLASVAASPAYLSSAATSLFAPARARRVYWVTLLAFWCVLLAVPLAGNLGAAWLIVEATTAASALLVGYSGRPKALEAGWKYLILTSLGLGVALFGVVALAASAGGGALDALSWRSLPSTQLDAETALVAYVLLVGGLAAKIGWAPVHNWLPDAHSEAPPPVSALLSAALLPAVLLVAWRAEQALAPTIGIGTAEVVLVGFGLVSLGVAVPFLWRALAWKRLLAYSSLEHMGVLALGVGFGSSLALAGVVVHLVGHALAKSLGFYAATPLVAHAPSAARHPASGIGRTQPALGASLGLSLGALAGLPPSPLFVSEVLIVAGGFQAGRPWAAAGAAFLLGLGFLGLAHALVDTTVGKPRGRRHEAIPGSRGLVVLTVIGTVLMLSLTVIGLWLPGSSVVDALTRGLG